jgi:transcriptional regulator
MRQVHAAWKGEEDRGWKLAMLERLTPTQQEGRPLPWHVGDAPVDYVDKLLRAIVGIESSIDRLEGKRKLSQDKAMQDEPCRTGSVRSMDCRPGLATKGARWRHW